MADEESPANGTFGPQQSRAFLILGVIFVVTAIPLMWVGSSPSAGITFLALGLPFIALGAAGVARASSNEDEDEDEASS